MTDSTFVPGLTDRRAKLSWLPDTRGFLAFAIVIMMSAFTLILLVRPPTIDDRVMNILALILGAKLGNLKEVYGYYFGSSMGSREATAALMVDSQKKTDALASSAPAAAATATVTKTETADSTTTTLSTAPGTAPPEPPKP